MRHHEFLQLKRDIHEAEKLIDNAKQRDPEGPIPEALTKILSIVDKLLEDAAYKEYRSE